MCDILLLISQESIVIKINKRDKLVLIDQKRTPSVVAVLNRPLYSPQFGGSLNTHSSRIVGRVLI